MENEETKISLGDDNTRYSYHSIQARRSRNYQIIDENGEMVRGEVVYIEVFKFFLAPPCTFACPL